MGALEGEEREKETERIFEEIMAESFSYFMISINLHTQAQLTLTWINLKKSVTIYVIVKMLKVEKKKC